MNTIYTDSLVEIYDNNFSTEPIDIKKFLYQPKCVVVKKYTQSWETGNSVVDSAPIVNIKDLFPDLSKVNVTMSLVTISGHTDEDVHFHTSHVIGYTVEGSGIFMASREEGSRIFLVEKYDVVIIPKNAMHYFVSDTTMKWLALEISDKEIDYQKHYTHDDLKDHI